MGGISFDGGFAKKSWDGGEGGEHAPSHYGKPCSILPNALYLSRKTFLLSNFSSVVGSVVFKHLKCDCFDYKMHLSL